MTKRPRPPKTSQHDHDQSPEAAPENEIGYGRPPRHRRFKPGQSGNLKGRPKQHRNVRTVVEEALNQRITIREGDRAHSRSKLDGVVLTILNKALQGDAKAQTMLIALLRSIGMTAETPEPTSAEPVTTHDADIIADFLRRQGASTENTAAPEHAVDDPQNTPLGKGSKS
jgi:hypothetical protein